MIQVGSASVQIKCHRQRGQQVQGHDFRPKLRVPDLWQGGEYVGNKGYNQRGACLSKLVTHCHNSA